MIERTTAEDLVPVLTIALITCNNNVYVELCQKGKEA